ncbi:MAG TPA: hypothetical protein VL125_12870 [Pelobium sp.]|nr:hypothetical protein [Pelobium sp.]
MQGLIIAFIIISFIYKAYKNFQKESEKAAQRAKEAEEHQKAFQRAKTLENNQRPVYEKAVEQPSFQSVYEKPLAKEYTPAPVFENNKSDYAKERAKAKEIREKAKPTKKTTTLDYYNPETPAEEVAQNRQIHQSHKHSFKFPKKEKHLAADFNFKQALIYDAILRRPDY